MQTMLVEDVPCLQDYVDCDQPLCPIVLCKDDMFKGSELTGDSILDCLNNAYVIFKSSGSKSGCSADHDDSSVDEDFYSAADDLDDIIDYSAFAVSLTNEILADSTIDVSTKNIAPLQITIPTTEVDSQADEIFQHQASNSTVDSLDIQVEWLNQFRRRSSNLSELPLRNESNGSQSSDFSSEFEELYDGFMRQEKNKKQQAIHEQSLPRINKYAESMVSSLLHDAVPHVQPSEKLPHKCLKPKAITLVNTAQVTETVVDGENTDIETHTLKSAKKVTDRLLSQVFSELQQEMMLSTPDSVKVVADNESLASDSSHFSPTSGNRLLASLTHWAQGAGERGESSNDESGIQSVDHYSNILSKVVLKGAIDQLCEVNKSVSSRKSSASEDNITEHKYLRQEFLGRRHSCFGRFEPDTIKESNDDLSHFAADLARRSSFQGHFTQFKDRHRRRSINGFQNETLSRFADELIQSNPNSPSFTMFEHFINHTSYSAPASRRGSGSLSSSRRGSVDIAFLRGHIPVIKELSPTLHDTPTLFNLDDYSTGLASNIICQSRLEIQQFLGFSTTLVKQIIQDAWVDISFGDCVSECSEYQDALEIPDEPDSMYHQNTKRNIRITNKEQYDMSVCWIAATMAGQPVYVQNINQAFMTKIDELLSQIKGQELKVGDMVGILINDEAHLH